ncbi:hypothetical protein CLJ1_6068 [Pseudomonas paraeruginosa]|nr:hypothetical protein CLJ1_6068 [Pseudomonas aeruginosa]
MAPGDLPAPRKWRITLCVIRPTGATSGLRSRVVRCGDELPVLPGNCGSRCSHGKRLPSQICRLAGARSGWSRLATVKSRVSTLSRVCSARLAPQRGQK